MDWKDFIFPARKPLNDAARQGQNSGQQQQPMQQDQRGAGLDIAGMAQDQANRVKNTVMGPQSPVGGIIKAMHPQTLQPGNTTVDSQPTMQQLQGTGSPGCPYCGK